MFSIFQRRVSKFLSVNLKPVSLNSSNDWASDGAGAAVLLMPLPFPKQADPFKRRGRHGRRVDRRRRLHFNWAWANHLIAVFNFFHLSSMLLRTDYRDWARRLHGRLSETQATVVEYLMQECAAWLRLPPDTMAGRGSRRHKVTDAYYEYFSKYWIPLSLNSL